MSRTLKPSQLDVDPTSPDAAKRWKHWKRTFDNFIAECGDDAPDRFRSIINFVSADVFEYVEECENYDQVVETLLRLYVKVPNKIFARHELASRKQKSGESLDEFLEELKRLSKHCNCIAVSADIYRSELIRDSFINGLSSNYIRQRLLENAELTLDQAYAQARTLDIAQKNSEVYMHQNNHPSSVAAASAKPIEVVEEEPEFLAAIRKSNAYKKLSYFCGGKLHANRASCPAYEAVCHNCSKTGHFAKLCKSVKKQCNAIHKQYHCTKPSLCAITAACPTNLNHASVPVTVNGKTVTALIDSCSSDSFISEEAFKKLNISFTPSRKQVSMALTSMESCIIGHCYLTIELNGQSYHNIRLEILQDLCSDLILGHDFQKQHENLTFKYGGTKPDLIIKPKSSRQPIISTVDTNETLDFPALADVEPPSLFKTLPSEIKPIATKSRFFNKDDRAFIDSQISTLLKAGLIQRSESPWRAQVLVVKEEFQRHRKRRCIDYSQTINLFTELDAYPLPRIDDITNKLCKYKLFSTYDLKSAYHQIPLKASERKYTAFEGLGDLYEFRVIPFGVTNGVPCFQRIIDDLVAEEGIENTFPYLDNVTIAGVDEADLKRNDEAFREIIKRRNIVLNELKTVQTVSEIDILGYLVIYNCIKPDPERLRPLLEFPAPKNAVSLKRALGMFAYYAKWIPQFSDKIRPLAESESFPLNEMAIESFDNLKKELGKVVLSPIDEETPFVVECDASEVAISASLNQNNRPVAFMSKTLSKSEGRYPAVEKEALSIIESVRKWKHFLSRKPFTLITDQRSVSFMFDSRKRTKIKNNKIQSWRLELAELSYTIQYREGKSNVVPDSFTRAHCLAISSKLEDIHAQLCHPGVTGLLHFIRIKNLPFSTEDVKRVCSNGRICAELKPKFYNTQHNKLIRSTRPMERISIDFKGPLPSSTRNKYFLTIVDEFSRFPFVVPCPDVSAATVIKCLDSIFALCGMPAFIHSDRGAAFMSAELNNYLSERGVATSHSTPYHPIGNAQVERYNGIVWKGIRLSLASAKLPVEQWEKVLPDVLHSVRSLLSTATNTTPHERFFNFQRKSSKGISLPSWLSPGPVLLRKFVRSSKHDDLVDEVELTHANPNYAHICHKDGRESTVSLSDIAPCPRVSNENSVEKLDISEEIASVNDYNAPEHVVNCDPVEAVDISEPISEPIKRSTRLRKKPEMYGFEDQ